jgi:hypothetical protein
MNAISLQSDKPVGPSTGILTKSAYAARWQVCKRTVDNWLAKGLPHFRIGERCLRIDPDVADSWMRDVFGTQRHGGKREEA